MVQRSKLLNGALWASQILVAAPFIIFGGMKILQPIVTLSAFLPWTGDLPPLIVRLLGVIDVAGGLGLILPGLTGIRPELTRTAAIGSILLQISAAIFHLSRHEAAALPFNIVFLALLGFILWGRSGPAPLVTRGIRAQ